MAYEPSFTEDTCADEADRRLLAPRACEECGAVMENGLSDVCAFCFDEDEWYDDDNDGPECHDCGQDLDPNGFCAYSFCPSADEDD